MVGLPHGPQSRVFAATSESSEVLRETVYLAESHHLFDLTQTTYRYESAGAALGHTKMSATAIYAERNQGLADEAAKRFG